MLRRPLYALFMLSMGVTVLVAAVSASGVMSATKNTTMLYVGVLDGVTFLDPQLAYADAAAKESWAVLDTTTLTLVRYPDSNQAFTPPLKLEGAAGYPVISNSGKTYTWQVRHGLKFNDGTLVTAAAYQRAFERLLSPCMYEGGIGVADFLDKYIVGGAAFRNAGCQVGTHISGVIAAAQTLTVNLTQQVPWFTTAMAMPWFSAVEPTTPYDSTPQTAGATVFYPSAGPYYVDSVTSGGIVLKKNLHYSGTRPQGRDQINILPSGSQTACYNALQGGEIDVDLCGLTSALATNADNAYGVHSVTGVPSVSGLPAVTAGSGGQYHVEKTNCVDYLAFDTQNAPTSNVNVRVALQYILDRKGLLDILGPYAGTLTDEILPPGMPGYSPGSIWPSSPDPSPFTDVHNYWGTDLAGSKFVIWHSDSTSRTQQAALIAADLGAYNSAQTAGMNITNVQSDGGNATQYYTILGTSPTAKFNIAPATWCADYPDQADVFNVLLSGLNIHSGPGNTNFSQFTGENALLTAAANSSGATRTQNYLDLDTLIREVDLPLFPYAVDYARILTSNTVGNWTYNKYLGSPALNALS